MEGFTIHNPSAVVHKNLHEPPALLNLGPKPKPLSKHEKNATVTVPKVCKSKTSTHKPCMSALKEAKKHIDELMGALENERYLRINLHTTATDAMKSMHTFAKKQHRDGGKIVIERNDANDKLREAEMDKVTLKKSVKQLEGQVKKLKTKIDSLNTKIERSKANKNDNRPPTVTPRNDNEAKRVHELQKMKLKYELQKEAEQRKEQAEARKEAKREKEKDSRRKIGQGLLGTSGMFNQSAKNILQQLVSYV